MIAMTLTVMHTVKYHNMQIRVEQDT